MKKRVIVRTFHWKLKSNFESYSGCTEIWQRKVTKLLPIKKIIIIIIQAILGYLFDKVNSQVLKINIKGKNIRN